MKNINIFILYFLFFSILSVFNGCKNTADLLEISIGGLSSRSKKMLQAHTVQIDPTFPLYRDRTPRSIADEIIANGIEGVYYFITSDKAIDKDIIDALHDRDIPVAALIIASGAYLPIDERPAAWEKWKMRFTTGGQTLEAYNFMSFVHKDYARWMKERVVNVVNDYDFDGFTFAGAMYPIYDGLEKDPVVYADISPAFQEAFKEQTANKEFPEFENGAADTYYKKRPDLYNDLVDFRVKTIDEFYNEVINGAGGFREKCPGKFAATWTLGVYDNGRFGDPVETLREWEGNDIRSMIALVKPDMHFIQTHWPDWMSAMDGDYVAHYQPFFDAVWESDADMPVALQTDIGSFEWSRKSKNWRTLFYKTCEQLHVSSTTYYEFSIRSEIYEDPPQLKEIRRVNNTTLELSFDQRIASPYCENLIRGKKIIVGDNGREYSVRSAETDGNILIIVTDTEIADLKSATVRLGGIKDDIQYRFHNANISLGKENIIPQNATKSLPI